MCTKLAQGAMSLLVAFALTGVAGCGEIDVPPDPPQCGLNQEQDCSCANGQTGIQTCLDLPEGRVWSACGQCTSDSDTTGSDTVDQDTVEDCVAGTDCDDDNLCTVDDTCQLDGSCAGEPVVCNDDDQCTADSCDPATGECVFSTEDKEGNVCDDDDGCTLDDRCLSGVCVGTFNDCEDGNPCTQGVCDSATGKCNQTLLTDPCDDGDLCTDNDTCSNGGCNGTAVECEDDEECTEDSCDPDTGECNFDAGAMNGSGCGNLCLIGAVCVDGSCEGTPKECPSDDPCILEYCEPSNGQCTQDFFSNNGETCDDDKQCTDKDACQNGVCKGSQVDCTDNDPCTIDLPCEESSAEVCEKLGATGAPCDDGDSCQSEDVCKAGVCIGCDDGDACTADSCNASSGTCIHEVLSPCP